MSPAVLFANIWLAASVAFAQPPKIGNCTVFPADNIWNTPIDRLPVSPNSSTYINTIGAKATVHADFGSGLWAGGPIGIPYITVPGTQTKYPASFLYSDESDPGPYAIPLNAPIEGGSQSSGDRHTISVDVDYCILYELGRAFPQTSSWQADAGAIFNLLSNALRPVTWTSTDAAGLPILAGLARYDEIAAGEIRHALRFTVPQTQRAYVWPARHYASNITDTTYPPMGLRVRLRASYDVSGFSATNQIILQALKKYGMILADNGSAWYISGAPDSRWDNDDLHQLGAVAGSDFEVVDVSPLMLDPNSGQASQANPSVITVQKTHSGNFIQGQNGALYAVTVSNSGASPTSGTVTVTETVPAGMTLVSMAGSGWACPANGNTCTRRDALPGGMSYPAVTVTVNVAANASSPQVNAVNVAGGGAATASTTDSTIVSQVPRAATITSPANGSVLGGSSVTFQWSAGAGVNEYWLSVSKVAVGGYELYNGDQGANTSKTVTNLPLDGSTIYVRLYSHIGTSWSSFNDYTYTAALAAPAAMSSPANGSTFPDSSVTFQWTAGTGVDQYWLSVSKVGVGGYELYNGNQGVGLSRTVTGLPMDRSTIYVRLYSHIGGAWAWTDYIYTAASPLAAMISPVNGSTLSGSSVTFQWTAGTGVDQYWLSVSKVAVGAYELYNGSQGVSLSKTLTGMPTDGSTIYVRLYSHTGGSWPWIDYRYTAASAMATMISPANGSTLPGSAVTFQWTAGIGVDQYWLSVSKVGAGGYELYNGSQGVSLSRTVTGLPADGSTIYVRLYSHTGGAWPWVDYIYTAF